MFRLDHTPFVSSLFETLARARSLADRQVRKAKTKVAKRHIKREAYRQRAARLQKVFSVFQLMCSRPTFQILYPEAPGFSRKVTTPAKPQSVVKPSKPVSTSSRPVPTPSTSTQSSSQSTTLVEVHASDLISAILNPVDLPVGSSPEVPITLSDDPTPVTHFTPAASTSSLFHSVSATDEFLAAAQEALKEQYEKQLRELLEKVNKR